MNAKRAIAAAFLVLAGVKSATAEDLLAGLPAEEYWRHEREFTELMPRAMAGDPVAQDRIGAFYEYGFNEQDYGLAALWYRRAAKQDNADAEFNLATLYLNGSGVSEDDDEGIALLKAAADQGHMIAQSRLGEALIHGWYGLKANDQQGWQLIHKAAQTGGSRAQTLWASHLWSNPRASRSGNQRAAKYRSAEALWELAQQTEGTPQGLAYLRQAAEAGDSRAMVGFGCSIIDSNPSEEGRREALRWFGQAVDQGEPNATFVVALLVQTGAIRADPAHRVFLASLFGDQLSSNPDPYRPSMLVVAMTGLSGADRDEVRMLRSQYRQRKILFDDFQLVPAGAAWDWRVACHTGI